MRRCHSAVRLVAATTLVGTPISARAAAPCEATWSEEFPSGEVRGNYTAFATLPDGSVVVGGTATFAGGIAANRIARWDGHRWWPMGAGMSGPVFSLSLFDPDGPGGAPLDLYAGGQFANADGAPVGSIARWDGLRWRPVGGGMNGPTLVPTVRALVVFDEDGDGASSPALFAGGQFANAGGVSAHGVARWNGSTWSSLQGGTGPSNVERALALAVFDDDGPGPNPSALYAAGYFTSMGGVAVSSIAKWDGAAWSPLAGGVSGGSQLVEALASFDPDGHGPAAASLFAAGWFTRAGGVTTGPLARWDGAAWASVGASFTAPVTGPYINALLPADPDGVGPAPSRLHIGGWFDSLNDVAVLNVVSWDGAAFWSIADAPVDEVVGFGAADPDGSGPSRERLWVFNHPRARLWDGAGWSELGNGLQGSAMCLAGC